MAEVSNMLNARIVGARKECVARSTLCSVRIKIYGSVKAGAADSSAEEDAIDRPKGPHGMC